MFYNTIKFPSQIQKSPNKNHCMNYKWKQKLYNVSINNALVTTN